MAFIPGVCRRSDPVFLQTCEGAVGYISELELERIVGPTGSDWEWWAGFAALRHREAVDGTVSAKLETMGKVTGILGRDKLLAAPRRHEPFQHLP